ncbi:MAG: aminotransferase class I/II-fold pyridoxal phosphate-dependent enzyme [Pseudomonadota bacterium]
MKSVKRTRSLAQRGDVAPFIAMDVMREAHNLAAHGRKVLHMEVGQPGFPAPKAVRDAAVRALASERLGYTEGTGLPALRDGIAAYYQDAHDVQIDPRRVVVTTGSSAGFIIAFLALFDAGEKILLPVPTYPAYRNILTALDLQPQMMHLPAAQYGVPTVNDVARAASADDKVAGLLVASPANPTGTVIGTDDLASLAGQCRSDALWLISDEIYHGLSYGSAVTDTALRHDDEAIVINSFSKYYCMTGWRIGWMIVPDRLVRVAERLAQNLFICAPALSQHAALAAFDATDDLTEVKAVYQQNRQMLLERLPAIGLPDLYPADGAFYIYANCGAYTNDSVAFAQMLLHEDGIAVTPGVDFDPVDGDRYIRLSYAGTTDTIEKALAKLEKRLANLR